MYSQAMFQRINQIFATFNKGMNQMGRAYTTSNTNKLGTEQAWSQVALRRWKFAVSGVGLLQKRGIFQWEVRNRQVKKRGNFSGIIPQSHRPNQRETEKSTQTHNFLESGSYRPPTVLQVQVFRVGFGMKSAALRLIDNRYDMPSSKYMVYINLSLHDTKTLTSRVGQDAPSGQKTPLGRW